MALSDYLTGEEWDACYYVAMVANRGQNLGDAMHVTIEVLLAGGYKFSGLDEYGDKLQQVGDGVNAPKMCIFLGNPYKVDQLALVENGRRFLKQHAPTMITETDEEWAGLVAKAKEEKVND
ncbi:hypothetical protein LCGC14_2729580 [marine sediment metagenome]|uniref:Uncharacterized protein n=1 Tax=marine sediment metagenome TaxID=412755 RepID=A0A0F9BZB8_9ZZZZ